MNRKHLALELEDMKLLGDDGMMMMASTLTNSHVTCYSAGGGNGQVTGLSLQVALTVR